MRTTILLLVIVTFTAVACGSGDTGPDDAGSGGISVAGDWALESGTFEGEPFPLVEGHRITMNLADGTIGGRAACNGYGGEYTLDGSVLTVTEWSITEMGCEPEIMASQDAFTDVLGAPMTVSRDAEVLIVSTDRAELRFTRVLPLPTASFVGTEWELDGLVDDDAVSSVMGDPAILHFSDDGTFTAATGCRRVSGTWAADGDTISPLSMSAEGECPSELERQDSWVISVFEGPFTIAIEGQRLTITAPGDEGLTFRATDG